jgi:hypothetical protein
MQAVTPFFIGINDAHHGSDELPTRYPPALHRFPSLVRSKDLT